MGESYLEALKGLNLDFPSIFLLSVTICAFLIPIVIILPPVSLDTSDALLQTHTQAGLEQSKSNLKSQYSSAEHQPKDGQPAKIQSLVIYPVKSCKGIEVARSRVLPQGLEFDRLFTFAQLKSPFPVPVDSSNEDKKSGHSWHFITQRQFPRLATVTVELWLPDEMKLRKQSLKAKEAYLILRFPWKERGLRGILSTMAAKLKKGLKGQAETEIFLPVDFPSKADVEARGYTYDHVTIWKETISALNMSKEIPEELRLYLGVSNKLALFRIDPVQLREVYRCAPRKEEAGYQPVTGFQDAYPLHLINLSSIQEFSKEVPKDQDMKQLDVRRFRANLILSGAPAYDEETWKQIRLKPGSSGLYTEVFLNISCHTVRCKMPNIDQDSGARHPVEPDKSLRTLRNVDEGAPLSGCLGMQATPLFDQGLSDEDRTGWVAVGMTVEVEQRGDHVYIKQ